ncbi:dynein intermediate chain 4, axonemal isoform X2 [Tachyglossus aculeatus]|uniref:dynein intermediate chain 4, axonemal isoform X2 n=1 Tax=Tachyglossus aculeatus TaxID=9261 RepID=UPI0018F6B15B|nr:dynein intermediate chain 4, axonemal isoform X2 [Tachyglossus aculeatus]
MADSRRSSRAGQSQSTTSTAFRNQPKRPSTTDQRKDSSASATRRLSVNPSRLGRFSRRSIVGVSDGRTADKGSLVGSKQIIQIFDEQGKDVTPRPLYHPDGTTQLKHSKFLGPQEISIMSDLTPSLSYYQTTIATVSFPFSRSAVGSSYFSKSSLSTTESLAEDIEEPLFKRDTLFSYSDVHVKKDVALEQLTKEDLEKKVEILLAETKTLVLLNLPPVMISVESEEAETVKNRNKAYEELCKNKPGNDRYVERMMQTFNSALKNKEVQCDQIVVEDEGIMVTTWDLYDSYNTLDLTSTAPETLTRATSRIQIEPTKDQDQKPSGVSMEASRAKSTMDVESLVLTKMQEEEEDHSEAIFRLETFQQDLVFMERILMENVFQPKLAAYRQLEVLKVQTKVKAEDSKKVPEEDFIDENMEEEGILSEEVSPQPAEVSPATLERLWAFSCELTKGYNVSSLAWNKANPWPERVYHSLHGVTSVDFSLSTPNLLAVGFFNGTVAIYNVCTDSTVPVLDSRESGHKHIGPIWQLKWIEQDRGMTGDDKGEILVTISADGRITKWIIRKGLDSHDLMRLKRTAPAKIRKSVGEKEKKGEALISRQAPGMCFDFHPKDTNLYLAGTEEGYIHKCSCSYNEQFLDTYRGHKGPVYKIAWNPFYHDMFLSCSADWGINLWRQDTLKPFLSFCSTTQVVYDIAWSPKSPYIFAAVNESRVELWDLHTSTLDPLIVNMSNPGIKFTTVLFAKNTDCILVGDSDGQVIVFEIRNLTISDMTREDAVHSLFGSAPPSQT